MIILVSLASSLNTATYANNMLTQQLMLMLTSIC